MTTGRWVRLAVVTTVAMGATLAVTAGPAAALPRSNRCAALLDAIDYDWYQVNNFAAWANINAHDNDWQDYQENMSEAGTWATQANYDTQAAQRAGCY